MSLRATLWAYDDAPVENGTEVLVLIALADEAADDGRNAFPSIRKVAARARVKKRAAQYALRKLENAGVIVRGDQAAAAKHIARADRRPTVYDLNLAMTWESVGKPRPGTEEDDPEDGVQNVHPAEQGERGAIPRPDGVQSDDERGAISQPDGVHAGAPDPYDPVTTNPTTDPTGSASASPGGGSTSKRGTRLPDDWTPSDALKEWFRTATLDRDNPQSPLLSTLVRPWPETEKFKDHWVAKPGKDGLKLDWDATWRKWIRTEAERAAQRQGRPQSNVHQLPTDHPDRVRRNGYFTPKGDTA